MWPSDWKKAAEKAWNNAPSTGQVLNNVKKGVEMQLRHYNGAWEAHFAPDFAYFYMSAYQVKTGRQISHVLIKVKNNHCMVINNICMIILFF